VSRSCRTLNPAHDTDWRFARKAAVLTPGRSGLSVIVVDPVAETQNLLSASLREAGFEVAAVSTGGEVLALVRERPADCIVMDVVLPDMDAFDAIRALHAVRHDVRIIVMSARPDVKTVVAAFDAGADEYLAKASASQEIPAMLTRVLQHASAAMKSEIPAGNSPRDGDDVLIGTSPGMIDVYKRVARVADLSSTVLITGETGSGKERIARAIHANGRRAALPFIAVDCAAIPENLFESEFFGHERGAFTGAHTVRRGVLEAAGEGTCFLDEIGELPLHLQAKLLRALQEKSVRRVGSSQTIAVSARIVSATNRDLSDYVHRGAFREDLYYRLNVVPINLPPLRERKDDIQALIEHFVAKFSAARPHPTRVMPDAMDVLLKYPWPGNVRQLENMIERMVVLSPYSVILREDLPIEILEAERLAQSIGFADAAERASPTMLRELNRRHIDAVLEKTGGNKLRAAQMLGIDRRTLYRILERIRKSENDSSPA
tara:strand:+ start:5425 stop:6894 length:1470 start_codon:yes stop_codon:yes gene_type:complete